MDLSNQRTRRMAEIYSKLLHGELEESDEYLVPHQAVTDTDYRHLVELNRAPEVRTQTHTPNGIPKNDNPPITLEAYQENEQALGTEFVEGVDEIYRIRDINLNPFESEVEHVQEIGELWEAAMDGDFTPIEIYEDELEDIMDSDTSSGRLITEEPVILGYPDTDKPEGSQNILFDYQLEIGDDGTPDESILVYNDQGDRGEYLEIRVEEGWTDHLETDLERMVVPDFEPSTDFNICFRLA